MIKKLLYDFNATDIVHKPIETMSSPFTNILGSAFWLIPIGFIAVALYVKTKTPVVSSVWIIGSCLLLGSGNLFSTAPEMSQVFFLFAILGFVGLFVSMYMMKK